MKQEVKYSKLVMMINNREEFEQRDDWLERERRREARVSVWDLDEGKKLRAEHEEDCERESAAEYHHQRHLNRSSVDYSATGEKPRTQPASVVWMVIDIFFLVFLSVLTSFRPVRYGFIPLVFLFLGINPGIFVWLGIKKRFPPAGYWRLLFNVTLIIEIYLLFGRAISFLIRRFM